MVNKDKIKLMTQLALYEKKYGEYDKNANGFFRHDFVYWENFWARLYALLGCIILIVFHIINETVIKEIDLFEIDYKAEGNKIAVFIIVTLIIYSLISTIVATREYSRIQQRIKHQLALMRKLDAYSAVNSNDSEGNWTEGDTRRNHGTSIRNKRGRR